MKNYIKTISLLLLFSIILLSCKNKITQTDTPVKVGETIISDYMFLKNSYFFINKNYLYNFEKGYSDDMQKFTYEIGKCILVFDVYTNTIASDCDAIKGIAVLNPENYDSLSLEDYNNIQPIEGKLEKTYFCKLTPGKDYDYDPYRGFFYLKTPASEKEVIAVSYLTDDEIQIGTSNGDIKSDTNVILISKLIKPQTLTPSNKDLWDLMMRNVYAINDTSKHLGNFNINIEYNNGSNYVDRQIENPMNTFINLLGLDLVDTNYSLMENGDGIVDCNLFIINTWNKIIIFPSDQPFDPLPERRFQLNESNRAKLYDIPVSNISELMMESRFRIVVEHFE